MLGTVESVTAANMLLHSLNFSHPFLHIFTKENPKSGQRKPQNYICAVCLENVSVETEGGKLCWGNPPENREIGEELDKN